MENGTTWQVFTPFLHRETSFVICCLRLGKPLKGVYPANKESPTASNDLLNPADMKTLLAWMSPLQE